MNIPRIGVVLWAVAALLGTTIAAPAASGGMESTTAPAVDTDLSYAGGCFWSGTRDVAVKGDYAYVVMHHGLATFDISNPSQPVQVHFTYIEFMWSWSIDISGNFACVVDYNNMYVFSLSSPETPYLSNQLEISGDIRNIAVSGSYAYVARTTDGLQIIDITDPYSPSLAGAYDTPGNARGIVVIDTLAYIADGNGGLRIINVADPYAPAPLGYVDNIGRPYDLAVLDGYAYMASDTGGVKVIDVSDPGSPFLVTTYKGSVEAENIVGKDSLIYVSDFSNGIDVVNIVEPSSPYSVGSLGVLGRVCDVSNYLSLIDYDSSFILVDVSDPQNPSLAGEYVTPTFGYEMVIDGDYAYGISTRLNVIDISVYYSPVAAGYLENVQGNALAKFDTLIFTVGRDSTLYVINVADPTDPQLVKTLKPIGYAYDIATDGEYAYIPTWQDGMVVVDVSDPLNPEVVANHLGLGFTNHVFLQGDYLYTGGISIINIADPFNPFVEGSYWGGGTAPADIVVVDSLAYIAGGDSELMIGMLEIGSVADPANPYHVGGYGTSNEANSVAVTGRTAFLTDYASLLAFDVSDPAAPLYLTGRPGPTFLDVAADEDHVYVGSGYGFLVYTLGNRCGDANNDASFNIGDAVYLIGYIFKGGSPPMPAECNGDANADGRINVGDAVFAINYVFRGGPPPPFTCCE
jgi:hypothetical protein